MLLVFGQETIVYSAHRTVEPHEPATQGIQLFHWVVNYLARDHKAVEEAGVPLLKTDGTDILEVEGIIKVHLLQVLASDRVP